MGGHFEILAISRAVPITGRRALIPGKAVLSLKLKEAISSAERPSHGKSRCLKIFVGRNKRSAPMPSYQARVGSE